MKVRADGVVLQRVLKELGQRDGRQGQLLRVGRLDVDREPHAAAVADVGQRPVPLERRELVGERNQRAAAAFEHVAVARAQGADEAGAASLR